MLLVIVIVHLNLMMIFSRRLINICCFLMGFLLFESIIFGVYRYSFYFKVSPYFNIIRIFQDAFSTYVLRVWIHFQKFPSNDNRYETLPFFYSIQVHSLNQILSFIDLLHLILFHWFLTLFFLIVENLMKIGLMRIHDNIRDKAGLITSAFLVHKTWEVFSFL